MLFVANGPVTLLHTLECVVIISLVFGGCVFSWLFAFGTINRNMFVLSLSSSHPFSLSPSLPHFLLSLPPSLSPSLPLSLSLPPSLPLSLAFFFPSLRCSQCVATEICGWCQLDFTCTGQNTLCTTGDWLRVSVTFPNLVV